MEKIFTVLVTKDEIENMKKILNDHHIKEDDMDISKVFNIQGHDLVYFIIVTDEETFTEIVEDGNGQRIY